VFTRHVTVTREHESLISGNDNIAAARVIVRRARAHSPRHRLHPMPSATGPTRRIAASPPRSNRQGEGLRDSKDARARWSSTTSHHRSPPASRPSDDRPADDACCDDRRVSLRHDRIRNADEETDDQSASPRRYRQLNSRREHSNRKPTGEGRRKRRRAIAEFEGEHQSHIERTNTTPAMTPNTRRFITPPVLSSVRSGKFQLNERAATTRI